MVSKIPEELPHLFYECLIHDKEREDLIYVFLLFDARTFTILKVLGPWLREDVTPRTFKFLLQFLLAPELTSAF